MSDAYNSVSMGSQRLRPPAAATYQGAVIQRLRTLRRRSIYFCGQLANVFIPADGAMGGLWNSRLPALSLPFAGTLGMLGTGKFVGEFMILFAVVLSR